MAQFNLRFLEVPYTQEDFRHILISLSAADIDILNRMVQSIVLYLEEV